MPPSVQQAIELHKAGRLDEAEAAYRALLEVDPAQLQAMHLLGVVAQQRGRDAEGIELIQRALDLGLQLPSAWSNLGLGQARLGRNEQALTSFAQALTLQPDYFEALFNRGKLLLTMQRAGDALRDLDRAAALAPARWQAHFSRGQAFESLLRYDRALLAYEQVLALQPEHHASLVGRGNALLLLRRPAEALACYDQALTVDPGALEVLNNRGSALRDLKRYLEAADSFARLAAERPQYPYVHSNRLHSQLYACDWTDYAARVDEVIAAVAAGEMADVPFSFLAICDSAELQLRCSRRYMADRFPMRAALAQARRREPGERLRIGYFSADFHEHATCFLMAGLFEAQDRERFEFHAFSHGPDSDDAMRRRLLPCFERFTDLRLKSDDEAAAIIRAAGIDILVDLNGFTWGNRAAVLAQRPAPVQAAFLGYPGSMGAEYIDYLIADAVVAPAQKQAFYSERLVHLPGSYQVNDRKRVLPSAAPDRASQGLPESGFVFCCFNNNYKINPPVFAIWMRLLQATPGSVLWLLADNADASRLLQAEASAAGIAADRLVFAPRKPLAEHLARHKCADLFLDTLPCNAHTTASDALWVGLPVLTCAGDAFASRVAASLVSAAGLPELVCNDLAEYEGLALALAHNPARLAALRERLDAQRWRCPLFDTVSFARHLEQAYAAIWDRHLTGQSPAAIVIAPN